MANLFSNTNCFFQQRINTLFASSDCLTKGSSLSTMVKNLVGFSTAAGDVWDVYSQNLRNYVGAYLVFNTNITTFYTNNNVSDVFNSFSVPSSNIISNSSCQYIYNSASSLYNEIHKNIDFFLMVSVFTFSISIIGIVMMFAIWEIEKRSINNSKIRNMDIEDADLERSKSRKKHGIESGLGNEINLTIQNIKD